MRSSIVLGMVIGLAVVGWGIFPHSVSAASPVRPSLKRFASCSVLATQIHSAVTNGMSYGGYGDDITARALPFQAPVPTTVAAPMAPTAESKAEDYSQTNIQVQGVDEGDRVKLDGRYAYHLTKNRLAISQVFPEDQAKLLSMNDLNTGFQAQEIYLEGDWLMLVGSRWEARVYPPVASQSGRFASPIWAGRSLSVAQVWNIKDRAHPKKERTVEFDGALSSSRLLNGRVYLVINAWTAWNGIYPYRSNVDLLPAYRDSNAGKSFIPLVRCTDVSYYELRPSAQYLTVVSLPLKGSGTIEKTVTLGSGETVYASTQNLYVTHQNWQIMPLVKRGMIAPAQTEELVIEKFTFVNGKVVYQGRGTVPGRLLNQFSMDEFNGDLRVATTKGNNWDTQNLSTSNVYVLSSDLKIRGRLEKLAPGEQIYAVRFMGKRAYIVTFKKIDPLFVVGLENPNAPTILGKLKIPGYSDYLHPIDETHLIGIGKNAVDAENTNFAWYQGIKMAIFDVTDVEHPREMWKTEIGDRGTDSLALHDHKAFLYSPSKQLLALPIQLAQLSAEQKSSTTTHASEYGETVYQGAYVYHLTLDRGFELMGRITHHLNNDAFQRSGYWFGDWNENIDRIQYVDNSLLTFSPAAIQLHRLTDLQSQSQVRYPMPVEEYPEDPILY